jgi:hypothetical protein
MSAYEKNKFTDAVPGQPTGAKPGTGGQEAGPPEDDATQREVAEQARRDEEARLVDRTREQRLIDVGRADQTTGRQ